MGPWDQKETNMKKVFIAITTLFLLVGCAGFATLPENSLAKRLISDDADTQAAAVLEYAKLTDYDQRKTALELVSILRYEYEPKVINRIAKALKDINAGPYVIEPIISSVKENSKIKDIGPLADFIGQAGAIGEESLSALQRYLKDDRWEVKKLAMISAVKLKSKAEILIPELIAAMKSCGDDVEKYYELYDTIAEINPEIAITQLIIDLKNSSKPIKEAALEGLFQLQVYLGKDSKLRKEIIPAIMRAIYSGDEDIEQLVEKMLGTLEKKDAAQIKAFLKSGKIAISGLMQVMGKSMEEVFKAQEEKMNTRMEDFYKSIGRQDALR